MDATNIYVRIRNPELEIRIVADFFAAKKSHQQELFN